MLLATEGRKHIVLIARIVWMDRMASSRLFLLYMQKIDSIQLNAHLERNLFYDQEYDSPNAKSVSSTRWWRVGSL